MTTEESNKEKQTSKKPIKRKRTIVKAKPREKIYKPTELCKTMPRYLKNNHGEYVAIGAEIKLKKVKEGRTVYITITEANQEDLEYFYNNGLTKLVEYDFADEPDSGTD